MYVERGVVVITVGSRPGESQIKTYGKPIFDSRFMKFVFKISEVKKL